MNTNYDDDKNFWGIPYGTEFTLEALLHDTWNTETDEILVPKKFVGLGWGVNFHAIGKKFGLIP